VVVRIRLTEATDTMYSFYLQRNVYTTENSLEHVVSVASLHCHVRLRVCSKRLRDRIDGSFRVNVACSSVVVYGVDLRVSSDCLAVVSTPQRQWTTLIGIDIRQSVIILSSTAPETVRTTLVPHLILKLFQLFLRTVSFKPIQNLIKI